MGEKFTSSQGQTTPSHIIWPLDAKSIPHPVSDQTFKVCPQVIHAEAASSSGRQQERIRSHPSLQTQQVTIYDRALGHNNQPMLIKCVLRQCPLDGITGPRRLRIHARHTANSKPKSGGKLFARDSWVDRSGVRGLCGKEQFRFPEELQVLLILAGVYCGRGRRADKALCCEEVTRGGLYYPRWVICNWSNPRVLARAC